jgi:hypothetical protein
VEGVVAALGGIAAQRPALGEVAEQRGEVRDHDGLAEEAVHPGLQAGGDAAARDVRGHRDDARPAARIAGADAAGGLQTVHLRHLHVHEHQVVRAAGQHLQGLRAAPRHVRAVAEPREHVPRDLLVHRVVLDDEDGQPAAVAQLERRGAQLLRLGRHRPGGAEVAQRRVDVRPLGGLRQHGVEDAGGAVRGAEGGRREQHQPGVRVHLPQVQAELHAVDAGEGVVDQRDEAGPELAGDRPGLVRGARRQHPHAVAPAPRRQHVPAGVAVVDDEQVLTGERAVPRYGERCRHGRLEGEGRRRPAADLRVELDRATHELGEPARDGQAEPGAAVLAGGRGVGLGEGV